MSTLTLFLIGPVRLIGPQGDDLTPHGARARGALALLGTASDLRMTRARLQDRLWSDRDPRQGGDSLRQMLRELRNALGPAHRDALLAGPGWIGLDAARIAIDLRARADATGEPEEFAAELDIPDPEFEDWLRDIRLHLADRPLPPPRPAAPAVMPAVVPAIAAAAPGPPPIAFTLAVAPPQVDDARAALLASMVLTDAVAQAAELIPASQSIADDQPGPGLRVRLLGTATGSEIVLVGQGDEIGSGTRCWSQRITLDRDPSAVQLQRAAATLAIGLVRTAHQMMPRGTATFPLSDLFSFSRERLLRAEQTLATSPVFADSAVSLAMRGWLRYTLILERLTPDPQSRLEEAEHFAALARERDPLHPTALAVSALLLAWRRDIGGALEMAQLATRVGPNHDLAQHALSEAMNDAGRNDEALAHAIRAGEGPMAMLGRATWLTRRMVAQIRMRRLLDAERSAEAALAHAPDSRPSLRMLAALRFHRGDASGAAEALARLRALEPDFSLDLMADPDYPVTTLRRAGLLSITRSGL